MALDGGGRNPVEVAGEPDGLWSSHRRRLTIGLVLTITLVAFETLAVATVMPEVKDDLGGLALYGWVFSGFFLGSLVGIVGAGQLADRHGLVLPYAAGLVLFAVGLAIGGAATSMPVLVAGRVLQGLGAGAIPPTAYAAIARGIPARLRPQMFAVLSTAWVVPGLVGPAAALAISHALSWRAVFWLLLPAVGLAAAMAVPSLVALGRAGADRPGVGGAHDGHLGKVLLLVAGVGALMVAGTGPPLGLLVALVVVGGPLAVHAVVRLLPAGTLRLVPGVPATVAVRGILTFAFFAADAYVPLAVVDGRGAPAWIAGAALTAASLTWASGSWTQARMLERVGPRRLGQVGFTSLSAGLLLALAAARGAPIGVIVLAWAVAGFGIGITYAPLSVTVLAAARTGEEGAASAAIHLSDNLGIALGTGLAGWFVSVSDARGWAVADGVTLVFALAVAMGLAGIAASRRLPDRLPVQDGEAPAAQLDG